MKLFFPFKIMYLLNLLIPSPQSISSQTSTSNPWSIFNDVSHNFNHNLVAPSIYTSHLGNSTNDNSLAYDLPLVSLSKPIQAPPIVSNPSTHLNPCSTKSLAFRSSPQYAQSYIHYSWHLAFASTLLMVSSSLWEKSSLFS